MAEFHCYLAFMNRFSWRANSREKSFIPAARNKFVPRSFSFTGKGKRRSPRGWSIRAKGDVNERPEGRLQFLFLAHREESSH
jgi:hypothetical protein